jgi:hypothetical protein
MGLNKLIGGEEEGFASLRSRIGDHQKESERSMREWQNNFGSSADACTTLQHSDIS